MKVKRLKTKKLFYNKWIYKIQCVVNGGWYLSMPPSRYSYWIGKMKPDSAQELDVVRSKLNNFIDKEIQLRFEYNRISIFCNDRVIFREIESTLNNWIHQIYEPDNNKEEEFLLSSGKRKRLCKKYPKGLYQYKAYFNTKVMNLDVRKSFYEWFLKYDVSKMHIPNKTKRWLLGLDLYGSSPFLYVSDQKMLSMTAMRLGNGIKTIEEFILENDINNG
jgi:hypothetical protein